MNQVWNLVSTTMLMLYWIFLNLSPLEGGRTTDPLPKRNIQNGLEFSLEFWVLLTKLPQKHFRRHGFKICGNEYSFLITDFNSFQTNVAFHIVTKHDLKSSRRIVRYLVLSNFLLVLTIFWFKSYAVSQLVS